MFKKLFREKIKYLAPRRQLELLEERIVLDASIDPIADQTVNEDATLNVDAHTPAEVTGDATYGLEVDDGSGGGYDDVATYNANNDPLGADIGFDPATGLITWTPTDSDVGTYSFRITATDNDPGNPAPLFDDEVFTVTVNNLIDFVSAANTDVDEDSALLYNVQTDSEDLGDPVSYSLIGEPSWVSIDSDTGVMTGNPDNTHVENSPYSFTVRASIGAEIVDQAFTLTVNNDDPAFLNVETDIYMTETSGPQTFDVQVDDEGYPPPSGMPGYSLVDYDGGGAGAVPGWLAINSVTGIITGNPLDADVGDHEVLVQFDDGNGGIETQLFNLYVENKTHFFTSSNGDIWVEDTSGQTFDVQTNEEGNGIVTFSFDAAGTVFQYDGWLNIDPNTGELTSVGDVDNSHVGDHTFTIYAQEGHGEAPITQDFTLTVVNDWPEITSPSAISVTEDAGVQTFQVEVDGAAGGTVEVGATFSLLYPPSYGAPASQVTIDPNTGLITIPDPVNADVGAYDPFVIRVDDGHGGIATQLVQIDIQNADPVWEDYTSTITANEDTAEIFDFNADDEGSGSWSYWITGGGGFLSIDNNGVLTVNGNNQDVGSYNVEVWFDDGNSGVISWSLTVDVQNVGPVFYTGNNVTWTEDGGYQEFDVNSDDEGQGLTYTIDWDISTAGVQAPPAWFNFNTTTGHFWGVPTNEHAGEWVFDIIANDGHAAATQEFTLTVDNVEAEFTTQDTVYFDINGGSQSFDVHTTDENFDGGGNQYVLIDTGTGIPSGVTIDSKTGVITWDGTGLGEGSYTFGVRFFDGVDWISPNQSFTLNVYDDTYMTGNIWGQPGYDDYQDGFYSINNTVMMEDGGVQLFDVEYINEGSGATYDFSGTNPPPTGVTIDTDSGVIKWDPTNKDVTIPEDGTAYTFDVLVDDTANGNGIITHEFTLDVQNLIPWYTTNNDTTWTEDQTGQTYDVNNTDEGDGGTTYAFKDDGNVTWDAQYYYWHGWLRIDIYTGELSMNPDDSTVDDTTPVPTNQHVGTHNFTILVDDQHGDPVEQDFTLTIGNSLSITNPASDFTVTWQEDDNTASINVDVNSTDEDYLVDGVPNNDVTYSLSNLPDWLELDVDIFIDSKTGEITTTTGISPDNTDVGSNTFTVNVSDGNGTASRTFTINVANRDPVFDQAVVYSNLHMTEDQDNTIDLEVDDEGYGRVIYAWDPATVDQVPQWMSLDPYTGQISGRPSNAQADDSYTFNVIAYDFNEAYKYGYSGIDGKTVQELTVIIDNVAPTFSSSNADSVDEDSSWTFNVETDDEGVGGTQYSLGATAPGWITIDSDTGVMTANPTNAEVGVHTFDIVVNDQNTGGVTTQEFTLTVNNVDPKFQTPKPPGGGGNPSYTITLTEDTTGNYYDLLTNDDGQHNPYANAGLGSQVVYSLDPATAPPGVRFANGFAGAAEDAYGYLESLDGLITMNPTNADIGTNTFEITLDDGNGGTAVMDFTITVVNTEPEFTTPNAVIWTEDHDTNLPFDVRTTDEPHDHWSGGSTHPANEYSLVNAPNWLQIDEDTGVLSINPLYTENADGTPDNHMVGVYNFQIKFFDGDVDIYQPFKLTVNNDPTVFQDEPATSTGYSDTYDSSLVAWNSVEQDELITITDAMVGTNDEYAATNTGAPDNVDIPYDEDYYQLHIKVDNQGGWKRVDNGYYNNNNGLGADITDFDPTTGAFTWRPNNADVPNDPTNGLYHYFRLRHFDHYGESYTTNDVSFFKVYVKNKTPDLPQDQPNDLIPDWTLVERTEHSYEGDGHIGPPPDPFVAPWDNDWIYPESLVQSNEEGVGVTYELTIDGEKVDQADPNGDSDYLALRPNGDNGGWVRFNIYTGQIEWETTNADVTTEIDGDEVRPLYDFKITANDGNQDANENDEHLSPTRAFTVQVWNKTTEITSYPSGGTITEDTDLSFNIQATDEQKERPLGDTYWKDTYYTLEINDGLVTDSDPDPENNWVDWTYYNTNNGSRAPIVFNEDTGQFDWDPNHEDSNHANDYKFKVTHYDGHDTDDTKYFTYTVENKPPTVILPTPYLEFQEDPNLGITSQYLYEINSDDELLGEEVEYMLEVFYDPDGDGPLGAGWREISLGSSAFINGSNGGELKFYGENPTGTLNSDGDPMYQNYWIEWQTKNEDTTMGEDANGDPTTHNPYQFRIMAREHDRTQWSDPGAGEFDVRVNNAATEFIPAPPADPIGDQVIDQGDLLQIDAETIDEYLDLHNYPADDYYKLELDFEDQNSWVYINDGDLAVTGGSPIGWDPKTGEITWTPNNLDVPNTESLNAVGEFRHNFRITHYDGHGSHVVDTFLLKVNNLPPEWIPTTDLPTWELWEDTDRSDVGGVNQNYDGVLPHTFIQTNEEGVGVTYDLQIWADTDGDTVYEWEDWVTGYHLNVGGGEIIFNENNGRIEWDTTNTDVTAKDGGLADLAPYRFQVRANDNTDPAGNGAYGVPEWKEFQVIVHNDPTDITDYPGMGTGDEITVTEDVLFTYNIEADPNEGTGGDEEVERPGLNTYYELFVDDGTGYKDFGQYNADNPLRGQITFNGLTAPNADPANHDWNYDGQFSWTPNNWDSIIGSYDFKVVHHDGNGSEVSQIFTVNVKNVAPAYDGNFPDDPGDPNDFVDIFEDAKSDGESQDRYTIDGSDINAINDEGQGLTYSLKVGTSTSDLKSASTLSTNPDYLGSAGWYMVQQNTGDGGWIYINEHSGEIVWLATNRDVTVDKGETASIGDAYLFEVTADDNSKDGDGVIKGYIHVNVYNDDTTINVDNWPGTLKEDGPGLQMLNSDVTAKDERVGPDHYELLVDRLGDAIAPVDVSLYNASSTAGGGARIDFNAVTGAIESWRPGNEDVGNYEFTFIHDDGHGSVVQSIHNLQVINESPTFRTTPNYAYGNTVVIPATKSLSYNPFTTDEGQHDWRDSDGDGVPDDQVIYTLNSGPPGMTIDPMTGYINWKAPASMAGLTFNVEIMVADGNGGTAKQSFTLIVDDPVQTQPIELRPYIDDNKGEDKSGYEGEYGLDGGLFGAKSVNGGLGGLVPMTWVEGRLLPDKIKLKTGYDYIEEFIRKGLHEFQEIIDSLPDSYSLEQPSLKIGGTIDPITPLGGHPDEVKEGKRLDFDADLVHLWNDMDLNQPSLDIGGSVSPHTPLEGYAKAVEQGKRLDFDHHPIEESMAFEMDELKVADILKL